MTNLQRLYPTDPSRSVDFNLTATEGLGRGTRGGGSDKAALLAAEAKGELPLALPAAPHHIDKDGSVKIPPKWENILAREVEKVQGGGAGGGGMGPPKTPPRGTGSAPKTPPRPLTPTGAN
jgi:pre-mRNA-splicing factor 18